MSRQSRINLAAKVHQFIEIHSGKILFFLFSCCLLFSLLRHGPHSDSISFEVRNIEHGSGRPQDDGAAETWTFSSEYCYQNGTVTLTREALINRPGDGPGDRRGGNFAENSSV